MRSSLLLSSLLSMAVAACDSTATEPDDMEATVASGVFACELEASCPVVCTDVAMGDCGGGEVAVSCVEDLYSTGAPGTILLQVRPGSESWMEDVLIVMYGDGTAVQQRRTRSCPDAEGSCDLSSQPWDVDPPTRCAVATFKIWDPFPKLLQCQLLEEDWTCDGLSAAASSPPSPTPCPSTYWLPDELEGAACLGDAMCESGELGCTWSIACVNGSWAAGDSMCSGDPSEP